MKDREALKNALARLNVLRENLIVKLSADPAPGDPPSPPDPAADQITGADGKIYKLMGPMEVGTEIKEISTEGEITPPDGPIEIEGGKIITIAEGKISEIQESPIPPAGDDIAAQMRALFAEIDPAGTSKDPRDLMLKALMESVFGWEIRSKEQEETKAQAIAAYQASLSALEQKNAELEKMISNLKEARAQENALILENAEAMLSAIEELSKSPNGGEPDGSGSPRKFPKRTNGGPLSRAGA